MLYDKRMPSLKDKLLEDYEKALTEKKQQEDARKKGKRSKSARREARSKVKVGVKKTNKKGK